MMIKNVFYAQQPNSVIINARGAKAIIEMPVDVSEIETEDGSQWKAEKVYYTETMNAPGLQKRVEENYDLWIEVAKQPAPQEVSLQDVVEAINALTDIIMGEE